MVPAAGGRVQHSSFLAQSVMRLVPRILTFSDELSLCSDKAIVDVC